MSTWRAAVKICPVPLSPLEPFDTLLGQMCAHCVDLQAGHSNTSTCSMGMVGGHKLSRQIPRESHRHPIATTSHLAQNTPQAYSPSPCLMVQAGRFITTLLSPSMSLVHAQSLQLCLNLFNPMDCSLPASSLHEILQARILEWVAMPSCKGSSQPRDRIQVSSIAGGFFTHGATWEAPYPL